MSYATAEHDRMIAALLMPCTVEALQLTPPRVRVRSGDWVSGWLRWHSQAAGQARHWRAPSLGEQGVLLSPSGRPEAGTFIPGLYGDAGPPADNRDTVEVWKFPDGGVLEYDWDAHSYSVTLPAGTVAVTVGGSSVTVTPGSIDISSGNVTITAGTATVEAGTVQVTAGTVTVSAGDITLDGRVSVSQNLTVAGNIDAAGSIMDAGGNSNHHTH
ncbi:phage baseplate assembly protein V [Pseudomonas aeruginosa]